MLRGVIFGGGKIYPKGNSKSGTSERLMQDGRDFLAGTPNFLRQSFVQASDILFVNKVGGRTGLDHFVGGPLD